MLVIKHHAKLILLLIAIACFQGFVCYITVLSPTGVIIDSASLVYDDAQDLKTHASQRTIDQLPSVLASLRVNTADLLIAIDQMKLLNYVPMVKPVYKDLPIIAKIIDEGLFVHQDFLENVAPFSLALGLDTSSGSEQYLENFLKISPQIIPILDTYLSDIEPVIVLVNDLSVDTYPNLGIPIRDYAREGVKLTQSFSENIPQIKEFVMQLPDLMGVDATKRYLVLFQNDKELRPTGGFITSFTILNSKSGEISFSEAKNIYEIRDDQVYYTPPAPIIKYLTETAWHMRDTNFSPDYKESMDMFHTYWKQIGQASVDGIIAIDTQFVSALLEFTGDVEIPDYSIDFSLFPYVPASCKDGGTTFTSENVVCRLEFYSSQLTSDQALRKDVIGALMNNIFDQVMSVKSTQWMPLFSVVTKQLDQKHVLLYFTDPELQDLSEQYNFSGRIVSTDEDYFHVNDANLAGLKSDMYLVRSVEHHYTRSDQGVITVKVNLTYENTGTFDGWLNATARNYLRVYVPKGSQLIDFSGGEAQSQVYNDLGKTVFDNFVRIPALSSQVVSFTYTIPRQDGDEFTLTIQKQPGKSSVKHTIFVNDKLEDSFDVTTDTVKTISW